MIPVNDLSRNLEDQQGILESIERVVRSGNWIQGPEHDSFELQFAKFIGTRFSFGVGNGTDALEIALRASGCVRGSNVITVANAGGYASIAAKSIGCNVIYCDVDPLSLVMDPESLKPLLSKRIAAVVVTHLFGNAAPVTTIVEMCKNFGIKVIEDCAQSIGGSENGNSLGSIGDIGTFSFYPTKNLGAIGDGGALTTNSDSLSRIIKSLRQYGWVDKYQIQFSGGRNSRLDEIQAAILSYRLKSLESSNAIRRNIVERYKIATENTLCRLVTSNTKDSAAHLAVLVLKAPNMQQDFRSYLRNLGIDSDWHYPRLDSDQFGLNQRSIEFELPVSRNSIELIVTVPLFPGLTDPEIETICNAIRSYK